MANVDIIKCVALFYKLGAAPKDLIPKEKCRIKLPRSLRKLRTYTQILLTGQQYYKKICTTEVSEGIHFST